MKTSTADANRERERDSTQRVFSSFSSRMNGDEIQLAAAWLAHGAWCILRRNEGPEK